MLPELNAVHERATQSDRNCAWFFLIVASVLSLAGYFGVDFVTDEANRPNAALYCSLTVATAAVACLLILPYLEKRRRATLERAKMIHAKLNIGPTNNPYSAIIEANVSAGVQRWSCVIAAEENHPAMKKRLKAELEGHVFVDSESQKPIAIRLESEVFLVCGIKEAS